MSINSEINEPAMAGRSGTRAPAPAPAGAPIATASGGPRPAPGTLTQLFFRAVERHDKPAALQYKDGGTWRSISHRELAERVRHCALGLREVGLQRGDRVAILSENRPEWAIADYACLTAGLTDVSIYPNLPAEQVRYILADSGSAAIFVSTAAQAAKVAEVRAQLPGLKLVVSFTPTRIDGADLTLAEVEARGKGAETPERVAQYRRDADAVKPDDVATLLYTSGTTGDP